MTRAFARMYEIDPERLDLAEEFKARPFGPCGPEVGRLVNGLRWGRRRGAAIERLEDCRFTNLAAGEWEVLKRRWTTATGASLAGRVHAPVHRAGGNPVHEPGHGPTIRRCAPAWSSSKPRRAAPSSRWPRSPGPAAWRTTTTTTTPPA